MRLTAEQRKIRDMILAEAARRGLPQHGRVVVSALETGLVESGLRNLPGGDADSQGWRQERASLYPNPRNLSASIRRYFDEATKANNGQGSAGQLAARVQRPAAQYRGRYDQRRQDAMQLLGGGGGGSRSSSRTTTTTTTDPGVDTSGERRQLIAQWLLSGGSDPVALAAQVAALKGQVAALKGQDRPATSTTTRTRTRTGGGASHQSTPGVLRGTRGKVIGTPYQGTHTLGNWQSDNAEDIATPTGTIVQMPGDGVVEKVKGSYSGGSSRFDGYQVTVRLADGNRVFYTHLSKTHVKPGMRLRRGQALGRSGAANGVQHLHIGVERGTPKRVTGE